jgi:hypothetical protein
MGEYAGDTGLMARPGPARRGRGGGRLLPAVVAIVVLAALVGAALVVVRRSQHGPANIPGTAAPITNPASSAPPGTPTGVSAPPRTVTVQIAQALEENLYAERVVDLFGRYFNAINRRDYTGWLGTLSVDRKPDSRDRFLQEFGTTADDQVRIVGLETSDTGLLVSVSFRSRQAPSLAPTDAAFDCLLWQVQYPVVNEDGELRISFVKPTNRSYNRCG